MIKYTTPNNSDYNNYCLTIKLFNQILVAHTLSFENNKQWHIYFNGKKCYPKQNKK